MKQGQTSNTGLSRQQLEEKVSRDLLAGLDGDLSNVSSEAVDVLASLGGSLFADNNTNSAQDKDDAQAIAQEILSQELFVQEDDIELIAEETLAEPIAQEDHLENLLTEDHFTEQETAEAVAETFLEEFSDALQNHPADETAASAEDEMQKEPSLNKQSFLQQLAHTTVWQRIFLAAMCLVCVVSLSSLCSRAIKENRLLASDLVFGVSMEGVCLEGMTKGQAAVAIEEIQSKKDTSQKFTLHAGTQTYTATIDTFSPVYDTDAALESAWRIGRTGSRSQRLFDICMSRAVPQEIAIPCSFDQAAVSGYVAALAEQIDRPVQEASLEFAPEQLRESDYPFIEMEESTGYSLDQTAAVDTIIACAVTGERTAQLPVIVTEPTVHLADLKENVQMMRTFTTQYARIANRTYNIHRATDTINGTVLQPGDEFSFNRIVGNTSLAENGYREAGVIVGGRSSTDRGGGVCQAATTLYNVAVRCDMEITARDPHAIASSYVPRGQDATIAYGHCDLAFINTSEYPVYIVGKYTDTSVTFTMYGRPLENGITIEMESEHLGTRSPGAAKVTEDPTKPVGYEETVVSALNGYDIRVYKVWYDADGNEIRRVVDHTDAYPTRRAEIIVGTKPAPEPTPDPGTGGGSTEPDVGTGGSTPDPGAGTEG
ncbi:MAG: VanW family protein [Clostridia bacterium]|nr:VanW family protein [Clostridia bacterium]